MDAKQQLQVCQTIPEHFELAKRLVAEYLGLDQAGLLLGLAELGLYNKGFIGAYYQPDANVIIINQMALSRLKQQRKDLYNTYLFHIILHEYVHAVGVYDEAETRKIVLELSQHYFGPAHDATVMAKDMSHFLPYVVYPGKEYTPPENLHIDFVLGIDKSNTNYIN